VVGEAWSGGFLPIVFIFMVFDLSTIDKPNIGAH
jgi:hypothetical protein